MACIMCVFLKQSQERIRTGAGEGAGVLGGGGGGGGPTNIFYIFNCSIPFTKFFHRVWVYIEVKGGPKKLH